MSGVKFKIYNERYGFHDIWMNFTDYLHTQGDWEDAYTRHLQALGATDPGPDHNYIIFESDAKLNWFLLKYA